MDTVKQVVVAHCLKVDDTVVFSWVAANYLPSPISVPSLDAFLAECARNFQDKPPTWHDIRSGKYTLVSCKTISQRFRVSRRKVIQYLQHYSLPYLKFPGKNGAVRYLDTNNLCRIFQTEQLQQISTYTIKEAACFLGMTTAAVRKLARTGKLESIARDPKTPKYHPPITAASLHLFLKERLPEWIHPEDWIKDCQKGGDRPLVPLAEAAVRLGMPNNRLLLKRLHDLEAWYIGTGARQPVLVSSLWLEDQEKDMRPLMNNEILRLFGCTSVAVILWRQEERIHCIIPAHTHNATTYSLWRSCWTAILKTSCSPGYEAYIEQFMTTQLGPNPNQIIDSKEAARLLSTSKAQLEAWAACGKVYGIRTPRGAWHFTRRHILHVRQAMGR